MTIETYIFAFSNTIGLLSRMFANGPGDRGSIQVKSYQRLKKKWYLMPPCLALSIIRYRSRVKWSNPGNGVVPSLHLSVVAIEKGAFGSSLTKVANFTFLLIPHNEVYYSSIIVLISCFVSYFSFFTLFCLFRAWVCVPFFLACFLIAFVSFYILGNLLVYSVTF